MQQWGHMSCQASGYDLANPAADAQVRNGLFRICKKILGEAGAIEAMLQLEAFRRREGCFGSERALTMVSQDASIPMVGRQRLRGGGWGAENCGPQGM